VTNNIIGKKIMNLRKQRNWSQEILAEKLDTSKSTISKIENGSRKLTTDELIHLTEIFNMSADYLLGLKDIPSELQKNHYDLANLLNSDVQLKYADQFIISEDEKDFFQTIISGHYQLKKQVQKHE